MNENYKNRIKNLCKEKSAYLEKMAACDKEKERMRQYVIAALEELKDTVKTVQEVAKKEGIEIFANGDYVIKMGKEFERIDHIEEKGRWVGNDLIETYRFTEECIDKRIAGVKELETSVDHWDRNFMSATQVREWIKEIYEAVCATLEKSVTKCKHMLEKAIANGSKEYEKVIQ